MSEFEYSGGALCLDFANTWSNRSDPGSDRLADYGDLVRWAVGSGALSPAESRELEGAARWDVRRANEVFEQAIVIRETVYRGCAAVSRDEPPNGGDLEILNRALASVPQRNLCCGGACCEWRWPESGPDLRRVFWPVVQSAAELLTSPDAARIRLCDAPDCSWLFLDRSRGGRRRWCDMSSCGNRAKARRYYARHHQNT